METFFYFVAGAIILLIMWEILFARDSVGHGAWDHSSPRSEIDEIKRTKNIDRH